MKINWKKWKFFLASSVLYIGILGVITEWWYFCLVGFALMEIVRTLFPDKE